jgi:hypothetical protein
MRPNYTLIRGYFYENRTSVMFCVYQHSAENGRTVSKRGNTLNITFRLPIETVFVT